MNNGLNIHITDMPKLIIYIGIIELQPTISKATVSVLFCINYLMEFTTVVVGECHIMDVIQDSIVNINDVLNILNLSEDHYELFYQNGNSISDVAISETEITNGSVIEAKFKGIICGNDVIPCHNKTLEDLMKNKDFIRNQEAMKLQASIVKDCVNCDMKSVIEEICNYSNVECLDFALDCGLESDECLFNDGEWNQSLLHYVNVDADMADTISEWTDDEAKY